MGKDKRIPEIARMYISERGPLACSFRQPAEKLFEHQQYELLQPFKVVGKLPTTTGWQPVLPGNGTVRLIIFVLYAPRSHATFLG